MRSPRVLFLAAFLADVAAWGWSWARLPARVPTHFGVGGEVDDWSSRSTALWVEAGLGLGTVALFAGLVWLVGRTPPTWVNVPHPQYWKQPEHLPTLRRLVQDDLWLLGAWTLLLIAVLQVLVVSAAGMARPDIDPGAAIATAVYVAGVLGRVVWMYARRYAVPPRDGGG